MIKNTTVIDGTGAPAFGPAESLIPDTGGVVPYVQHYNHSEEQARAYQDADDEIGTIEVGKKTDLVIVEESPLNNLKTIYGTGHMKYNDEKKRVERVGGASLS